MAEPVPSPAVDERSAADVAAEAGDYSLFDQIVDDYVSEIRGERRTHRRTKPEDVGPTGCPDCGHPLTGSVRPNRHGRPCMALLEETVDGRGIPLRCQCETV